MQTQKIKMSDKDHHIDAYSLEDIRRYLEARMPEGEMHALEKAALDDPFLADAIEGMQHLMQAHGRESLEGSMQELQNRLLERLAGNKKSVRKMVLPAWARSAAAIGILFGIGWLADHFLLKTKPVHQNIAKSNESVSDSNDAMRHAEKPITDSISKPAIQEVHKKSGNQSGKKDTPHHDDLSAAPPKKPVQPVLSKAEPETGKSIPDEPAATLKKEKAPEVSDKISREEEIAPSAKPLAAASVAPDSHLFKGVVIDANSMPVQGATITLSNSNKKTKTNDRGEFALEVGSDGQLVHMEVNAIGYTQRSFSIDKNGLDRKIITLEPDSSSLKEVVVSDYHANQIRESKIDERNSADINATLAAPSNGWNAFYEWLNKNKKINKSDSVLKGTEIISFQVDRKGALSSFRSEQSISKAHLAEAIRLIREGPVWICLKGKKQRVTVYINF